MAVSLSRTFLVRCALFNGPKGHRAFIATLGAVPSGVVPSMNHCRMMCYRTFHSQSRTLFPSNSSVLHIGNQRVRYSGTTPLPKQSYTQRVKVVLKEYGPVAVVFHTVMSLFSLGTCYLLVSSGLDVDAILKYFNVNSSDAKKGASTLAIAYVLHKFLLPLRCTVTVVSVPVIVRQLRARGWMQAPLKQAVSKLNKTVGKTKK